MCIDPAEETLVQQEALYLGSLREAVDLSRDERHRQIWSGRVESWEKWLDSWYREEMDRDELDEHIAELRELVDDDDSDWEKVLEIAERVAKERTEE